MMKKYFAVFLSASIGAGAADFVTGQAARAIFGQQTFTAQSQDVVVTPGLAPTPYTLGAPAGVAYANNMLFVADANRIGATPLYQRVLIYNNISSRLTAPTQDVVVSTNTTDFVRCPVCLGTTQQDLAITVLGGGSSDIASADYIDFGTAADKFRTPAAVATDGNILAVVDTDNNRVLIWKSIPTTNGQPADIVLGQADFTSVKSVTIVDAKSFRAPQGVWIQGNRLFVADTVNNRVLIWNSIPTSNNQAADIVLGVPNFTTPPQIDLTKAAPPTASNMSSPVSVTSDGTHLFVTDLGNHRVLIWNSIPTQNGQAADFEVGQPNMTTAIDNDAFTGLPAQSSTDTTNKETPAMCTTPVPNSADLANNPTYPFLCEYTLSFPRFALSDGARLFIADGGNDRILVYNTIPQKNAAAADEVLGQGDFVSNITTDQDNSFTVDADIARGASNTIRTPMSLAWDGTNLYAADAFDRRVMVFTPGPALVPLNGIVNSASLTVSAIATIDFTGTITAGDTLTITIAGKAYTYTVVTADTIETIVTNLVNLINASGGDTNVLAIANTAFDEIVLTSRLPGSAGNSITLALASTGAGSTSTTTNNATEILTASGPSLVRGGSAAEVAPGSLITINGTSLCDCPDTGVAADPNAESLPTMLGGVELYLNGLKAPLLYVSPTQINAQLPFEMLDTSSASAYVRIVHSDGSITYSAAVNVPVVLDNPGIFAYNGSEPRQAIAYHASSNALALVDIEGTIQVGDTATVTVDNKNYSYAVQSTDTLDSVRDALVAVVNADPEARVVATASGQYDRVILTAKVPGPEGNGIPIGATSSSTVAAGATITLTALQSQTAGASVAGALVTQDNPAVPGELITIYAAGLGVIGPDAAKNLATTGAKYPLDGPPNTPTAPVDDAQVGGITANVLFSGLVPGAVGVYAVQLQLASTLPTNPETQMFIAQDIFTSNIVTIPVVAPTPTQ